MYKIVLQVRQKPDIISHQSINSITQTAIPARCTYGTKEMLNNIILESQPPPTVTPSYTMVDSLLTDATSSLLDNNGSYPVTELTTSHSTSGSINCNLGVTDCAITV